jgi:hypothetical protein
MYWYNLFHYKYSKSPFLVWICYLLIHQIPHRNVMSVCPPRTSKHYYGVFHSVTYMDGNIEQPNLNVTMYRSTPTLSLPLYVTWPVRGSACLNHVQDGMNVFGKHFRWNMINSFKYVYTNKMQRYAIFFITVNALHVSGGLSLMMMIYGFMKFDTLRL